MTDVCFCTDEAWILDQYIYIYGMYVYVRIYQLHWSPKILNLSQPWLSQSHFSGLGMGKLAANPVFHPLSSRCLRDGDWGGSGSPEGNHFSPNWTVAIGYSHLCFLFSEKKNYRSELKHLPRYPLVNCHKKRTGKIQHFSWKNPLWLDWAVSSWGFQTNGSKSFSLWLGVGDSQWLFRLFQWLEAHNWWLLAVNGC